MSEADKLLRAKRRTRTTSIGALVVGLLILTGGRSRRPSRLWRLLRWSKPPRLADLRAALDELAEPAGNAMGAASL